MRSTLLLFSLAPFFAFAACSSPSTEYNDSATADELEVEPEGDGGLAAWHPLTNKASFEADTPLLLTDGTVMVHVYQGSGWWRLTPNKFGSYTNGTWSQMASMPAGYQPLYYASAVLADGRVVVEGGEYNGGGPTETNLGAIYDPKADKWQSLTPPAGWDAIGDASGMVLPDGRFLLANTETSQEAILDPKTLTYSSTGTGKADRNSEETWTLLPGGKILTVDCSNGMNSEIYDSAKGSWSTAGSTGVQLADPSSLEIGPAILMPNGKVFAMGATAHTAIFTPNATPLGGTWTPGPDFPNVPGEGQEDIADGPAALLPSGQVLAVTSPGTYQINARFYVFDGTSLSEVPRPPNAVNVSSYQVRLLVLPSGQVMAVDGSTDVMIWSPPGQADPAWRPHITSAPSTVTRGSTYKLSGRQLNGLSQAVSYGDDAQAATNYPLVRIENIATKHIFYTRTHDHSTMDVATGTKIVSTSFDVPAGVETGPSRLRVVTNGIHSLSVAVTVQ
jgi:hypothetical protein